MRPFITRNPVLTLVGLTLLTQFAIVIVAWILLPEGAKIHDDPTVHMIFRMRVFGPLLYAVLLTWYLERANGLRTLFGAYFNWKVPAKWYLMAFSWKFMFTYVGMGIVVLIGLGEWPGFFVNRLITGENPALYGLLMNFPFIVGIAVVEETAWMKFSVTRLQERYSALASCLIVGLCWGLWYLPMLLLGDGVPDGYTWPMFMASMFALTIFLGWTYNMTHSGTILLVMQIVSNCAFFIMPVLPSWWGLNDVYVNSFVVVNVCVATFLVIRFGPRHLGTRPRATWREAAAEVEAAREEGLQPVPRSA